MSIYYDKLPFAVISSCQTICTAFCSKQSKTMITISRKAICLILVMIYEKCETAPLDENDGDSLRIVNGNKATPGQFPFAVSLQNFVTERGKYAHRCTLSLITTKTCLGAAHCAKEDDEPIPVEKFCGIVGTIDQTQKTLCQNFSNIFIHEDFKKILVINDVATFIFLDEIKLDKKLADIVPLIGASGIIKKDVVTALGWGYMHNMTYDDTPKTLRYVELNLAPARKCHMNNDTKLCISTRDKGICSGDSGGPIIINQSEKQIQIGIISYTLWDCAFRYSVATDVRAFTEWIEKHSTGKPMFILT